MAADAAVAIGRRAAARGLDLAPEVIERLAGYLNVLSFWNRRTNLTSFDLFDPTDGALDRLIFEGVEAAPLLLQGTAIDVGSGGGSPAIPVAICRPDVAFTLVESRTRKAAFLREALRTLGLPGEVANVRAEELELAESAANVTMRAVRADAGLVSAIGGFLASDGRFLWFGADEDADAVNAQFRLIKISGQVAVFVPKGHG